jgi:putative lipoprotein
MLDRITELFIFGFVPLVVGIAAVPASLAAAEKSLKGEVVYRERIALPPQALLLVKLFDPSKSGPEAIIGKQAITPKTSVPIAFEIAYDPSVIQPGKHYALQAVITVDDQPMFTNDQPQPVDLTSDLKPIVLLKMVLPQDKAAPHAAPAQ